MIIRICVVIFLITLLSGCATTNKRTQEVKMHQLQSRVSDLEAELRSRDQEINRLETELERRQEARTKSYEGRDKIEDLSMKQIQAALRNAGFYKGPIDGKLGPKTKEAIRAFQKANGLTPDGIIGSKTKSKLSKNLID